jgi:hypothetical protein
MHCRPPSVPVSSTLSFSRLPVYAYCLIISFLYVNLLCVPRVSGNISPIANGSSGVVLFSTQGVQLNLTNAVSVFLLTLTFIALIELMNCTNLISCVIVPLLVLADRLVVHSVSVSVVFTLQVVLLFAAFRVLLSKAGGWSVVVSFVLLGVAAAWRLEFVVFFIPLLLVSVCEKKKYREAALGFALSFVILVIGQQTDGASVRDVSAGNLLRSWVLIKADKGGLCWAAIITAMMALWRRVDTFLFIGLALAAIVAVVCPIQSRQDHEVSGLIAVKLIACVWVANEAKRNTSWVLAGVMLVRVMVPYILASVVG